MSLDSHPDPNQPRRRKRPPPEEAASGQRRSRRQRPLPSAAGAPAPVPPEEVAPPGTGRDWLLMSMGVGGALGIAALFLSSINVQSCRGATRSATLEFEQQQNDAASQIAQIEAMRAAQAESKSGAAEPVE